MHKRLRMIVPVLLLAIIGGWWWSQRASAADGSNGLTGSGTIEAEEILITAEVGGRVRELLVDEGQEVKAQEILVRLDTALLEAQYAQAQAAVEVAEANLAQLKAGAREEEIAQAQAQLDQAQAARNGAAKAHENALRILENPQELEAMVVQARAARDAAQAQLAQVRAGSRPEDINASEAAVAQSKANAQTTRDQLSAAKTQAEIAVEQATNALRQAQQNYSTASWQYQHVQEHGTDPIQQQIKNQQTGAPSDNELNDFQKQLYKDKLDAATLALSNAEEALRQAEVVAERARQAEITGVQTVEEQIKVSESTLAKARNGATREQLAIAQTALTNAQRALDVALATKADPLQLKAVVDTTQAQLAAADAQVAQSQARLELVKNGARSEQIQAAEAQLAQARAATNQVKVQLDKTTLVAPQAGMILSRSILQGQHAAPGAPLMTVGSLDTVRLMLYISETDIGRVQQGQKVNITVDTYPGRVFTGAVTYIAPQAQFTPRNVQTKAERATTVFPVRVELPNPEHTLKPGMPADATIVE